MNDSNMHNLNVHLPQTQPSVSLPSTAPSVEKPGVPSKGVSPTQSTIEQAKEEWSVLVNQTTNQVPPLTPPTSSQSNIMNVIEDSITAMAAVGLDTGPTVQKQSNWIQMELEQQEMALAVDGAADAASPAAPAASQSQDVNGLAAFATVYNQINQTELALREAEAGWIYQLNQLSVNQLNSLTQKADAINSLQTELQNDQTTLQQMNFNMNSSQGYPDQLFALDVQAYHLLESSNFNNKFWKQFKKDDPADYNLIQTALSGYDVKDNAWTNQAFLSLVPDIQTALQNQAVYNLFNSTATEQQKQQWNQISAQWNTTYAEYEYDKNEIPVLQNQINQIGGPDGALAQATNSFNSALEAVGITNVTPQNLQQFEQILQVMDRMKEAITRIGDLDSSFGLAVFTQVKNALETSNQKLMTLMTGNTQEMDAMNLNAANTLQEINQQVNQLQETISGLQSNVETLQTTATCLSAALAGLTIAAIATSWIPGVGEATAAAAAATAASLGGVEIAIGVDNMEIAQDQEAIAGDQKEAANIMANAQFTSQISSNLVQGITQLSKNMQAAEQTAFQMYTNISNATGA